MKNIEIEKILKSFGLTEYLDHDLIYTRVFKLGDRGIRVHFREFNKDKDINELEIYDISPVDGFITPVFHEIHNGIDRIKSVIRNSIDP